MRLIVTAMKNEGPFILEWVAYHRAIGVDQFLVYTNDCDDGTDAIWRRLAALGYGAHELNDKIKARGVQKTALMRADDHALVRDAEWLGCLDVDEFINIRHGEGRLDDLFAAVGEADLIVMAWRRFGANRTISFRDQPVLAQFTRAAPENCPFPFHNYGIKSLWRANGAYDRIGVHRPLDPNPERLSDIRVVNAVGQELPPYRDKRIWLLPQIAGYAGAQVNHYTLRSAESFLVKRDRGLPNSKVTDLDLGYWAERNFNVEEEVSIQARMPAMQAELEKLLADPELAELHNAACEWHRDRIKTLLAEPETMKLFLRIIATETAVLPPRAAAALNPLIAKSWEADRARRKSRGDNH